MPNKEEHAFIGFVIAAGAYALVKYTQKEEINPAHALGWGCVGAGAALLPDVLEPATSPMHRAFAHSIVTAGVITYSTKKAWDSQNLTKDQKAAAVSMSAAYLSHLLLDSQTPAGLPLF